MAANYNNSAWFYDRLSQLIYGHALINAQVYLLEFIPANSRVLIVGGGTGWILEQLTQLHPSGLQITYVEIAANMMELSQKRNTGENQVIFINDAVENVALYDFDVVITPFLFDNFTEETTRNIFNHIHKSLKTNGIWLISDFQLTGKWWQTALLRSMFVFFRIICRIESSKLPDVEKQFELYGYKATNRKTFYGDFIISKVYNRI